MFSSLAVALAAQQPRGKGTKCGVAVILESLDAEDYIALEGALNSAMFSSDISRALGTENHKIAGSTIARHRKQECNCGPR